MDRTKAFACVGAVLLLASCSSRPVVVVGSKNFTEQVVLGEILSQQIERRLGVRVDRRLNLGGTLLAHEALTRGSIDLYPEYTGTALTAVLKEEPQNDSGAVLDRVRAAYRERWNVQWMQPLGFNNTFAMVVRSEAAGRLREPTLSEASASRQRWKLGVGFEFLQRPDGLPGLLKTYDLVLEGSPVTMDLGLLYQALETGKVDMVAANSTDGLLSAMDLKVLEDDRDYFPPYECAVLVRADTLRQHEGLAQALEELSGALSNEAMRRLNHAVDGEHRSARDVAAEFLKSVD